MKISESLEHCVHTWFAGLVQPRYVKLIEALQNAYVAMPEECQKVKAF